jgi:hypothetical protein
MQVAATPSLGNVPIRDIAANPGRFDGARVYVSGTYIDSTKQVYDPSDIVSMGVPGPIKGAAGIAVEGLSESFLDGLRKDEAYGTAERWDDVTLGGVLDVRNGAALLKVDDAEYAPAAGAADDSGGFVDDEIAGTVS